MHGWGEADVLGCATRHDHRRFRHVLAARARQRWTSQLSGSPNQMPENVQDPPAQPSKGACRPRQKHHDPIPFGLGTIPTPQSAIDPDIHIRPYTIHRPPSSRDSRLAMSAQQYYNQQPGYGGPPQGYNPGYGAAPYPQYPQPVSLDPRLDDSLLCWPETNRRSVADTRCRRTRARRPRATIRLRTRCSTSPSPSRARAAAAAGAASRDVWQPSASAVSWTSAAIV